MCGGQTGLSGLVISAKSIVETCGCQADDADTVGVAVGDAVGVAVGVAVGDAVGVAVGDAGVAVGAGGAGVADLGAIPVDGIVVG